MIDGWVISCEITLRWMSQGLTDDTSTLVQVIAWCRQATSHYLSQCWPRSLSPYGVTRPQWVNVSAILIQHCLWLAVGVIRLCSQNFIQYLNDPWEMWQHFNCVIFKHMLQIKFMSSFCEISPWRIPKNTLDDKSTGDAEPMLAKVYIATWGY